MFNPNEHMMKLKGKDYLQVAWRLVWFRDIESGCGTDWGLQTELLEHGDDWAVFKATITNQEGKVISTGHGSESKKDFGDYLEKAETKAVGRALAMLGFGTQFAADELDEGERIVDSPVDRTPTIYCADCGRPIRPGKKNDGSVWPPVEIAAYTKAFAGRELCIDCGKVEKQKQYETRR